MKGKRDYVVEAAEARTDLTIFHAVIAMLEGGTLSARAAPAAGRIIRQCRDAAQTCLVRYDAAHLKAKQGRVE